MRLLPDYEPIEQPIFAFYAQRRDIIPAVRECDAPPKAGSFMPIPDVDKLNAPPIVDGSLSGDGHDEVTRHVVKRGGGAAVELFQA